jgi:hypothetical protein
VAEQTPDDFTGLPVADENVERLRVDTPEHDPVELRKTAGDNRLRLRIAVAGKGQDRVGSHELVSSAASISTTSIE